LEESVKMPHLNHRMSVGQMNPTKQVNAGGFFEVPLVSVCNAAVDKHLMVCIA